MDTKYKDYFDIDPDYFPAVNPDVIKSNPELWKKFYPHETFIKLINDIVSVLNCQQKQNIWVEGAYGTGKSHAVLTLKRLLDSTEQETKEYFETFKLDQDLMKKFLYVKREGKILTIHRYASSSIKGDNDLFIAIQESIEQALYDAGIDNAAHGAMKDAVVKYLSDDINKQYFNELIKGPYSSLFGGNDADKIVKDIQVFTEDALRELMRKIFKVANERQIKAFTLDDSGLCEWIREVIEQNNLNAIVFIWDEFTEYFQNNMTSLTGFQTILELSATARFYFIPVTHKSEALFNAADRMKNKILDRFVRPRCVIELPENMAFQLMGAAMQKSPDPVVNKEWTEEILPDLCNRTVSSRKIVGEQTKLNDEQMKGILPIHPYAASLLKHISTSFDSNQRSMFDFIKNDRGDNTKAFQWFIKNCSPLDDNPLLTIDMLWNFFYDMGKESLALSIRQILDNYPRLSRAKLLEDEKRILKAVLLFQAISFEVRDSVDLFLANEKNLNSAFEGSDLEAKASHIAEKLVEDRILFKKIIGKSEVYSVLVGEVADGQIDKYKKKYETKTTTSLITEGCLDEAIELPAALRLRYKLTYASLTDFEQSAKRWINEAQKDQKHLYAVVTFAKDASERMILSQKIKTKLAENPDTSVVFIDCSKTVLGEEKFDEWVEYKAKADFHSGKDKDQSTQNTNYANDVLKTWRNNIKGGEFVYYSKERLNGETLATEEALMDELRAYNRKVFSNALECYNVIANMWTLNAARQGAECGLKEEIVGTFRSANQNTKLEVALAGAWGISDYWISSPSLNISIIKAKLEDLMKTELQKDGRVSIKTIFDTLSIAPYGFMPCNLSAFILGFLLKEYCGGKYTWSDGTTSDELTLDKMKEMIHEILQQEKTPNPRYRDKYIVTMPQEVKAFIDATSKAFGISKSQCTSVEAARERVRAKMRDLSFPIWLLNYIIEGESLYTDTEVVKRLIELYGFLANNVKDETGMSENDIAIEIGKICMKHETAIADLEKLFTSDKCLEGVKAFLDVYANGELIRLAQSVNDGNQYVNVLRSKFSVDAANWVWRKETAQDVIDSVILEYRIIEESNRWVDTSKSYKEALRGWSSKANNMRLAYSAIKNDIDDLDVFLDNINEICETGQLQEQHKEAFLKNMSDYGEKFVDFYNNRQKEVFKKVCDFELTGLSDADKDKVFGAMPMGCFTKDKVGYISMVTKMVEEQKKGLSSMKLKNLWLEKTNTSNPYQWSEQYNMPILAMLNEDEYSICRKVFYTINSKNADAKDISDAITYLENAKFFDSLNNSEQRDKMFVKNIIQDNAVMLADINEVKNYLRSHVTDSPYEWLSSPAVKSTLNKMAEAKYCKEGYVIAFRKIDQMSAEDVKQYLKDLIKNNKNVGVEIIKNN
ncbi:hypothetical protein M2480_002561 [Parabacteroides sp. PFB2-12]|uniref:hypothetical protein n=1 Tax=unclassified Parabacteroides TaxID=2649774 RepID=UPI002476D49F|nr:MULTISPECIES: hypothetical protein [unclassified Parabacteroides]MDH6344119.1 hypothetical protein [Parabacteroides sp. PM6-13]MDH6391566.1 hypothetical protein [Parabacteroides sp. PFB2-12]